MEESKSENITTKNSKVTGQNTPSTLSAIIPAAQHKRLLNYWIDLSFIVVLIGFYVLFHYLIFHEFSAGFEALIAVITIYILYFMPFERIWGKTPAKFITHTKVYSKDGKKANILQIFIRNISRFIPFEYLTYLFKLNPFGLALNPVGFHDKLSSTVVIDERNNNPSTVKTISAIGLLFIIQFVGIIVVITVMTIFATLTWFGFGEKFMEIHKEKLLYESGAPKDTILKNYSNRDLGISFYYPATWTQGKLSDTSNINILFNKAGTGSSVYFQMLTPRKAEGGLDFESNKLTMDLTQKGYSLVEIKKLIIAEQPFRQITTITTLPIDGKYSKTLYSITVKGGKLYTFIYDAYTDDYYKSLPEALIFTNSLSIDNSNFSK